MHAQFYIVWSPIAKLLSKLDSLMVSHPTEVLQSIKEYIGVEDFHEGIHVWFSNAKQLRSFTRVHKTVYNWKDIPKSLHVFVFCALKHYVWWCLVRPWGIIWWHVVSMLSQKSKNKVHVCVVMLFIRGVFLEDQRDITNSLLIGLFKLSGCVSARKTLLLWSTQGLLLP